MSKNESKKNVIDFKVARFKYKAKQAFNNGVDWVVDNKELVMFLAPVVIGGVNTVVRQTGKAINLNKEQKLKDNYVYDHSAGHYWELKRKLTKSEWLEVDKRKINGERYADILADMNVLK